MLGALAMLAAPVVEAQHWGRPDFPRTGACFFRDADFEGDYFCANVGRELSSLPSGVNDQISSIRTLGDVEVTIFQDGRFEGRSTRFRGDVRSLKDEGWNDRISSLRVRGSQGGGHSSADPDRIVRRAYEDILDREPDTAGLRLYRRRIIDDGWSEQDVREALRKSPEYAQRSSESADKIVRRAYEDVLGRAPDAAGLSSYRNKILNQGWSEQDVREALRKSPELRQKSAMTREQAEAVVRRAYQSVLGREPDAGSRGYVDHVLRDHWSEADVARELRKSEEYRSKHR
jgi:TorA maturation chaperone TorD